MQGNVCIKDREDVSRVNEGAEGANELEFDEWVWRRRPRHLDNGVNEGDGIVRALWRVIVINLVLLCVVEGG